MAAGNGQSSEAAAATPGATGAPNATAVETVLSAPEGAGDPCVLLKFGELTLKGRKRRRFAVELERNLRAAAGDARPLEVRYRGSSFVVLAAREHLRTVVEAAVDLPGLSVVQPALRVEPTMDAACEAAIALLRERPGASFAVRARRREKGSPLRSDDVARVVGAAVQAQLGLAVDLDAPDLEAHVQAGTREVFVAVDRLRGVGGLPVGTSGSALVLLSGGIDSPVAAWRMIKRGLRCDFVHFTGQPLTGPESAYKAYALVAALRRFQGSARLFVIPLGFAQRLLAASDAGRFQVLAQRRLMVRAAGALARRQGHDALVTGDSLGQVASQTVRNLDVVERAAPLPILRPLLDRDKEEIVAEARRLGTYEVSILPDEDCCTLLAHPRAVTWADEAPLAAIERRIDAEVVVEQLVEKARTLVPSVGRGDPRCRDADAASRRGVGKPVA